MKSSFLALGLFLCALGSSVSASTAPNILLILSDDAGYADFGFQGGGIAGDFAPLTPNIDSIAGGGVRFTNGYVSGAVCCPSRAGLLTGRYQGRFGFENNVQQFAGAGLAVTQKIIADTLKALGYRTYMLGKWHLGDELPAHHPNQRGFDEFYGFLSGARTYFQFNGANNSNKLQRNGVFVTETPGQYVTDLLGDEAAAYIDDHVVNHAGQPFFIYLAFNAVHTPLEADDPRLMDPRIQSIAVPERKTLAAMTIALDDAVGSVLAKVAEHNLANDTLVVFLNDNGGPEDNLALEAPNWSDNGPLRGNKTQVYEGGIRVAFAIKWPGCIPVALEGTGIDDPVISLDLLPTFVAAAGGSLLPGQETDGISLLPRLTGASSTPIPRCFFWRTNGSETGRSAVRQGDWKLHRENNGSTPPELYDLAGDLGETTNLASAMPEKVAELEAQLAEFERELIEPLWGGGALTLSSPDLTIAHADIGIELGKATTGFAYAYDDRRVPLALDENWSLEYSVERFDPGGGLTRHGFITLGGSGATNSFVRLGAFFNQGILEIQELGTGQITQLTGLTFPGAGVLNFRVTYDAATMTLSLTWNGETVSHALSATWLGTYTEFTHTGYGIAQTTTRYSPINFYIDRLAGNASPTWARMKIARDYTPGTVDGMGNFMGGTEAVSLVTHKGKLYAGIGYWNDLFFGTGSPDPHPGPQVLVKEAHDAPWKQDLATGPDFLRIENLNSMTFTTDKTGAPLDPQVTLLLAGTGELSTVGPQRRPVVWIRNDATGAWTATYPSAPSTGNQVTRTLVDHVDSVTGIHHVFVGFGAANCELVRGGYNAATGLIDWEGSTPELTGTERIVSAGECNGVLYACVGSNGVDGDDIGGLFWREDGPSPQWHFAYEWPVNTRNPDIRGFTAMPHPKGFAYDVALVTLESFGKVYCIDPLGGDPRNGHVVEEELNIQQFLGDKWNNGVPIGFPTLCSYNNMPELPHPATGAPVYFIGMWVNHPNGAGTPERNNSWYLIRHQDGSYEWAQVIDPGEPLPNPGTGGLRATRGIRLSPFPEDKGKVIFFSGFDAASQTGPVYHNTAWIYRGELPEEQAAIDISGPNPVLSIDTAYGWQYRIEESTNLQLWQPAGAPFSGDNTVQGIEVLGADPARDFFRTGFSRLE